MREIIITNKGRVFSRLAEAARISNNARIPIKILLGRSASQEHKAILLGEDFWEEIREVVFGSDDDISFERLLPDRLPINNEENPDYGALKQIIEALNSKGMPLNTGLISKGIEVKTIDNYVLLSCEDWERIAETYHAVKLLQKEPCSMRLMVEYRKDRYIVRLGATAKDRLDESSMTSVHKRITAILDNLSEEPNCDSFNKKALCGRLAGWFSKSYAMEDRIIFDIDEKNKNVNVVAIVALSNTPYNKIITI